MIRIDNDDCLETMKGMKSDSIDLIIADYPFNCQDGRKDYLKFVHNTAEQFLRILKPNCVLVMINNPPNIFKTIGYFGGFVYRNGIALIRKGALRPAWHFGFQHNYCLILVKPAEEGETDIRLKWNGVKKNHDKTFMTDVIEYQNGYRGKGKAWHPQAIPLDLTKKFIEIFSNKGDMIYDPFTGSGTTAVACAETFTDRDFLGTEYNKKYYDMANKRIERIVNQKTVGDFEK